MGIYSSFPLCTCMSIWAMVLHMLVVYIGLIINVLPRYDMGSLRKGNGNTPRFDCDLSQVYKLRTVLSSADTCEWGWLTL